MTEAVWFGATDPMQMLSSLQGKINERTLRLFACSWFSDVTHWAKVADIVAVGEQYADGVASRVDIEAAQSRALRSGAAQSVWVTVCDDIANRLNPVFSHEIAGLVGSHERYTSSLRDIVGNPFRPATADPSWLTATVVSLAQHIYDSRDFAAMPILADALQDAGCAEPPVLNHCRCEGLHVRGCHVVDLLLGKG